VSGRGEPEHQLSGDVGPGDAPEPHRALLVLAIALVCAGFNLFLYRVALDTMVSLSGEFRGYAEAGAMRRLIISGAHSTPLRLGVLPGVSWIGCAATLWRTYGPRAAPGISAGVTVLAFLVSFYVAGALWGS
jgi:hypothetical protein